MFSMFQCVTAKSIPPAATPNVPSLADPKKVLMCVCVCQTLCAQVITSKAFVFPPFFQVTAAALDNLSVLVFSNFFPKSELLAANTQ